MLFGDAGTATAIEYDKRSPDSYFILGSDGSGENNLIIPNSCYKPHIKNNNKFDGHNLDYLFMDGPEVFSFTLKNVPLLLKDLLILSGQKSTDIDKYLFHQANLFMLNYLIKQTNIDIKDAPINIQKFGNTSGATIPLLISDQLLDTMTKSYKVMMLGFGVGYSWAGLVVDMNNLLVNKILEV